MATNDKILTTSDKIKEFYGKFNNLIAEMPIGVRFQIAEAMLSDVSYSLHRYRNPLAKEVMDQLDEVSSLRQQYKKIQANRDNRGPAEITAPQYSTSADGGKVA